jgi:hypothetical protein
MDSGLVDAWDSDERFDELVDLGTEATRVPVGGGFAGDHRRRQRQRRRMDRGFPRPVPRWSQECW